MTATRCGGTDLTAALDALRQADRHVETPPRVEAAVLAAWDRAHVARTTHRRNLWREAVATAAAVTIAVGLAQLGRELRQTTRPAGTPIDDGRTVLLVGEPILEGEPVRVVRMRVPASALMALGVRPAAADVAHVDVDVIVGEDGVARAIRVGM